MAIPEDTTRGQEAGNIIDWIVHIVSFAEDLRMQGPSLIFQGRSSKAKDHEPPHDMDFCHR